MSDTDIHVLKVDDTVVATVEVPVGSFDVNFDYTVTKGSKTVTHTSKYSETENIEELDVDKLNNLFGIEE